MGIIKVSDFSEELNHFQNKFHMRLEKWSRNNEWHGFQPDIKIMPLYCGICQKQLKDFYIHTGSRYGCVGTVVCDYCGTELQVLDGDNIVDHIIVGQETFDFGELYKTSWKYTRYFENNCKLNLEVVFKNGEFITILEAIEILQNAIGIYTTGKYRFVTDNRITELPFEINRWIELLDCINAKNVYLYKY